MAAGSTAALVCDTGALLDYLVERAPDHRLFRYAIDQGGVQTHHAIVIVVKKHRAIIGVLDEQRRLTPDSAS